MMTAPGKTMEPPKDWHPQDWIIIVEALAQWAGPPKETGPREERAYELIEDIADTESLRASELIKQGITYTRNGR